MSRGCRAGAARRALGEKHLHGPHLQPKPAPSASFSETQGRAVHPSTPPALYSRSKCQPRTSKQGATRAQEPSGAFPLCHIQPRAPRLPQPSAGAAAPRARALLPTVDFKRQQGTPVFPRASRPAQVIKLFLGARRESAPLRSHKPRWSWD